MNIPQINKILKKYKREVRGSFKDNPGYMELRDIREDKERLIRTSDDELFEGYINQVLVTHQVGQQEN